MSGVHDKELGVSQASIQSIDVTYSDLTVLISNSALKKNRFYRITDFRTRHQIPNTSDIWEETVEALSVLAISSNKLHLNAYSSDFPQDVIHYVVDNVISGADRGTIIYREDSLLNTSAFEDFRGVKYRRWETSIGSGVYTLLTDPMGGEGSRDAYPFGNQRNVTLSGNKFDFFSGLSNNIIETSSQFNLLGVTDSTVLAGINGTVLHGNSITETQSNTLNVKRLRTFGGQQVKITTVSGNANLGLDDFFVSVDCSGGSMTLTLPSSPVEGQQYFIKDSTGSSQSNNITVDGNGKNIDVNSTFLIDINFEEIILTYDGISWNVLVFSDYVQRGTQNFTTLHWDVATTKWKENLNFRTISVSSNNVIAGINTGNTSMTGVRNTILGDASFINNTSGTDNVAFGYQVLNANTSGGNNLGIGNYALKANTIGIYNLAIGDSSAFSQVSANFNISIGANTLLSNVSGSNNVVLGYRSMENSLSSFNVAVGYQALKNQTTGSENVAIGWQALTSLTSGVGNTALGTSAGGSMNGTRNTAIGYGAANGGIVTGNDNTFIGARVAENVTDGISNNIAIGNFNTLRVLSSGDNNFATNPFSLKSLATGTSNVAICSSGENIQTGNYNILIGDSAGNGGVSNITLNDTIAIGAAALTLIGSGCLNNIAIGKSAGSLLTSGSRNVIVGNNTILQLNSSDVILLGDSANVQAADISVGVAIGSSAILAGANQLVFGSASAILKDLFFGKGFEHASAVNCTLQNSDIGTAGGNPNDVSSGSLTIQSGKSTGTGTGGNIIFAVSPPDVMSSANKNNQVIQLQVKDGGVIVENKLNVTTGANKSLGQTALSGGTVTVSTTQIKSTSTVFLTYQTQGVGMSTLYVSNILDGVSFDINGGGGSDNGVVGWWIIN